MTHETQGKRWPPTAGVEADYITVDTRGAGALAAERLRLHGIPHSTVTQHDWLGGNYAAFVLRSNEDARPKPPTLEGWSFSVYNGAEEQASGWGSKSLEDMTPALLAAVGMTDATTAHKRAQVAETRVIDLAHERDGAVEALDITYDKIAKLRTLLFGAGFEDDLLTSVQRLITQRDALADGCRDFAVKAVDAEETIAELREERKDLSAVLKRWEDFVRGYLPTVTLATNTADRHFDLRVALGDDVIYALKRELSTAQSERDAAKRELTEAQAQLRDISHVLGPRRGDEPVTAQAERARNILARWQDLAVRHLPSCPQLSNTLAGADLGTRHFELRSYIKGEIGAMKRRADAFFTDDIEVIKAERDAARDAAAMCLATRDAENFALRARLSLCAEREDQTIAALGHPCSTNGIPEAVRLLRKDAERWLTECGEVGARAAAYSAENVRLSTQRDDACAAAKQWEAEARKAWAYDDQIGRVLPAGNPNDGLLERAVTLAGEADRLRDQAATLQEQSEEGWAEARRASKVLAIVRKALETPDGECLADHAAKVYKNSERADRMTEEVTRLNKTLENTGGYGARERAKCLAAEVERLTSKSIEQLTTITNECTALSKWQTWARNKIGVNATLSDESLRNAIDASGKSAAVAVTDLRAEVDSWKAEAARTFAQLQEAYDAMNSTAVLSDECRAAIDYLIAHPGRGLTAELAHEGAKALRQRLENGLPLTQPLRYLIDMALTEGVDAAHRMWDAEVQRTRDESTTLRKRLDQWVAWGCRAACVINADDDSLRMLIDRALPMWRRGTPTPQV